MYNFFMRNNLRTVGLASISFFANNKRENALAESNSKPPSIEARSIHQYRKKNKIKSSGDLLIISGTGHDALSSEVAKLCGVKLTDARLGRFADGEVDIQIHEDIRGKSIFIIKTCSAPVNESILELLLTISAVRRASVKRITVVIPYFGYKHHRRGSSISSLHHSRFLSSFAVDFAKMISVMGADRVISVDLQRPGQGGEACFFDNNIPLETIITTDMMINFCIQKFELMHPNSKSGSPPGLVVVAPNAECVVKARKFQLSFAKHFGTDVKLAVFSHDHSGNVASSFSVSCM